MSRIRSIPRGDYRVMPWKNGKGETVEIARLPSGGTGLDDFDWRVSVAPVVTDGAFSVFPGIERTIVVIEGAGMELTLADGRVRRLLPSEPFTYDGGMAVEGRLTGGPVRDLNLMVRRGRLRGTLMLADGRVALSGGAAAAVVACALLGSWRCCGAVVAAGDSLLIEDAVELIAEPAANGSRIAIAVVGAV